MAPRFIKKVRKLFGKGRRDPKSEIITNIPEDLSSPSLSRGPYQYTPLENTTTWIRLLEFLPGDKLRCKIHHYELDRAPHYVALSYAWGDPTPSTPIQIDNTDLKIHESLFVALDHLRQRVIDHDVLLWADGICINQLDDKERSEQVQQMGNVYKEADSVFVWLGEANENLDIDHTISHMDKWLAKQLNGEAVDLNRYLESVEVEDPFFYGPPGSDGYRAWEGIMDIWKSKWWRRAWAVQECALAYNVRLFYGKYEISYNHLNPVTNIQEELIQRFEVFEVAHSTGPNWITEFRSDYKGYFSANGNSEGHQGLPFLEVLVRFRSFGCSDPRDRVYAAIGLSCDIKQGDIKPDYTLSVADVFTMATKHCFEHAPPGKSLDFLACIFDRYGHGDKHHSGPEKLPSWVPDWCEDGPHYRFLKYIGHDQNILAYHASGDTTVDAYIDGREFFVQGFILDTIVDCQRESNRERHEDITIEQQWNPGNLKDPYPGGGDVENAYMRCLCADVSRTWIEGSDRPGVHRDFKADWATMVPARWHRESMFQSVKTTTIGRRLIITEKGYIGIAPGTSRVGDKVAVLFGGQMLYVIRDNEDATYGMLGEAYVQGLMDGEAMDEKLFPRNSQKFRLV